MSKVHEIVHGATELRKHICRRPIVVVDWSASWCGPCRRVRPTLDRLAQELPQACFLNVQIDASESNQALATEAGVRALPTFQFYVMGKLESSFTGGDGARVENETKRWLEDLQRYGSDPEAVEMGNRAAEAMKRMKDSCTDYEKFEEAARTCAKFVENALANPNEVKYRRVRIGNRAVQERLAHVDGGLDALRAFGFKDQVIEGEDYLVLDALRPCMNHVKRQLEFAIMAGMVEGPARPVSQRQSLSSVSQNTEESMRELVAELAKNFQGTAGGGPSSTQ